MTLMKGTCDVCDRERKLYVCSSSLAPMSLAFCTECLVLGAEPLSAVVTNVWMVGGDLNAFHPAILDIRVYHNREYRTIAEWATETDLAAICKQLDDEYEQVHVHMLPPTGGSDGDGIPF